MPCGLIERENDQGSGDDVGRSPAQWVVAPPSSWAFSPGGGPGRGLSGSLWGAHQSDGSGLGRRSGRLDGVVARTVALMIVRRALGILGCGPCLWTPARAAESPAATPEAGENGRPMRGMADEPEPTTPEEAERG